MQPLFLCNSKIVCWYTKANKMLFLSGRIRETPHSPQHLGRKLLLSLSCLIFPPCAGFCVKAACRDTGVNFSSQRFMGRTIDTVWKPQSPLAMTGTASRCLGPFLQKVSYPQAHSCTSSFPLLLAPSPITSDL